jgi:hypothetical protein|tara:strand:- start:203 stop:985 length:783 start_codon:yes stop_codon:yes gene_type:complete
MIKIVCENMALEQLIKPDFTRLMHHFNVSKEDIIQHFLSYNTGIKESTNNEFYESIESRFVLHIHAMIENSYHQNIQNTVLEYIRSNPSIQSIVEVGFGFPSKHVTELALRDRKHSVTLADKYSSAIEYSKEYLKMIDYSYGEVIDFKIADMDKQPLLGEYDCYVFLDSIEHTLNPTEYLKKTIMGAPKNSTFILSLPICEPLPFHYIHWNTAEEAKNWLTKCGLYANKMSQVDVNPEVDLFAEKIDGGLYNLVVECKKQ